jgi:hypothetical protein
MTDIDQLRQDVTAAQRRHARAQHDAEQAQAGLEAARAALRDEFGVETAEDAQALAERLEGELGAEADRVRELLEQAGGQAE